MLERVEIKGYKSAYDVSLKLGRLTVLVGANGSGKTSILEAIAGAAAVLSGRVTVSSSLDSFGVGPDEMAEVVSWGAEESKIQLVSSVEPKLGRLSVRPNAEFKKRLLSSIGDPNRASFPPKHGPWLRDALLLQLDPNLIAEPSVSEEERPLFASTGANAGPVLDAMSRDMTDRLTVDLQAVVPSVSGIRAGRKKIPGRATVGHEPVLSMCGHDVRARHASEGTNLVLGILLALSSAAEHTTVLLDDMQRGLHPRAQAEVIGAMRGLLARRPDLQVIGTTHSPYLIDELEVEEVAVVVQREGRAHVRSLSEHPDAERWKGELRTGEFWSAVGEDWVAES